MYKLLIEGNDRFQTVVPITPDGVTIGRNEGNTARLPERNVSRQHAKITVEGDTVYFEEISARYGSEKNGRRITKKEKFTTNDVFEIGDYSLRIERDTSKPPVIEFDDVPTRVTPRAETGDQPARLVVTSSNFAGQEFNLVYQSCIIGRDESCDIVIEHRSVSARHARIEHKNDQYMIQDLNSSNGTAINGRLTNTHRLISGDIIDLGQVTLRFIGPGEAFTFVIPEAPLVRERNMHRSTAIFGLIFAALILVIAIGSIAFFFGSSKHRHETTNTAISESLTAAINSLETADSGEQQKIIKEIARAKTQYNHAEMEAAIATLTNARNNLKPTARQRETIDDMIDAARLELEPSKTVKKIEENIKQKKWIDALDALESLQDASTSPVIDKYLTDNRIRQKVTDNAIKEAKKGTNDDRTRVEMLLSSIDPDDPRVDQLIANNDSNSNDEPVQKTSAPSRPSRRPASRPKPAAKSDSAPSDAPPAGPERQEYIDQLTSAAMKYLFKGDYAKSIRSCKTVFRIQRDDPKCLNIMGLNYEKTGDTKRACQFFKQAGSREKLRKLDCN